MATSGLSCGPGIKPASSGLEGEVLTTGSPGKSLHVLLTAFLSDRIVVRILKDFHFDTSACTLAQVETEGTLVKDVGPKDFGFINRM